MTKIIKLKRGIGKPTTENLDTNEVAIDSDKRILYFKDSDNSIKGIGANSFIKGWGYQDFNAGDISDTTVTLTSNQNGDNIAFDNTKVVSNSAVICQDDNTDLLYTGTTKLFSVRVKVTAHTTDTVTISGIPHISWGAVRIWYIYVYESYPDNTTVAPKFIQNKIITELDYLFITHEEVVNNVTTDDTTTPLSATQGKLLQDTKVGLTGNETINGVKTFGSFPITPSAEPTQDYEIANKKYVDENGGGGAGKLDATVTPTINDDNTLGYSIGSMWLIPSTGAQYICTDDTTGAAYWYKLNAQPASLIQVPSIIKGSYNKVSLTSFVTSVNGATENGIQFEVRNTSYDIVLADSGILSAGSSYHVPSSIAVGTTVHVRGRHRSSNANTWSEWSDYYTFVTVTDITYISYAYAPTLYNSYSASGPTLRQQNNWLTTSPTMLHGATVLDGARLQVNLDVNSLNINIYSSHRLEIGSAPYYMNFKIYVNSYPASTSTGGYYQAFTTYGRNMTFQVSVNQNDIITFYMEHYSPPGYGSYQPNGAYTIYHYNVTISGTGS